jgi:hypothetical protein
MSPQEDYILEITSPDMDSLLQTEGFIGEGAIKSMKKFYESFIGWYLTDQDPSVSSFHMASKVKGSYLKKNPSLLFHMSSSHSIRRCQEGWERLQPVILLYRFRYN